MYVAMYIYTCIKQGDYECTEISIGRCHASGTFSSTLAAGGPQIFQYRTQREHVLPKRRCQHKANDVKFSRMIFGGNIPENICRPEKFQEFSVSLSEKRKHETVAYYCAYYSCTVFYSFYFSIFKFFFIISNKCTANTITVRVYHNSVSLCNLHFYVFHIFVSLSGNLHLRLAKLRKFLNCSC